MSLNAGTKVGPYEILSALGAGGMGEVYKARDTRLDRIVAIKVLPDALAADPQFRERFEREARAISQLTHPHICTLYDIGRQDLTDFLVMEYLEGETLADRLVKGALPFDQALAIAIQIALALDTAHRAGIVHRDLKPGNIMLIKAGAGVARQGSLHAKLLDFGLAKASAPAGAGAGFSMLPTTPPGLTVQGTILGTFQYMAPEQLEGQEADARTDIFAFGAVLYETLTGRKAFEGKSHASLIGAILKDEPPPISTVQPLSPAALDRVVRKCLAKDPEARWHSAYDLHDELTWIAGAGETAPRAVAASVSPPPTQGHTRERLAWVVVAVATAAASGIGTLQFARARHEPATAIRFQVSPPAGSSIPGGPGAPWQALSPDGHRIAFIVNTAGQSALAVRSFDAVEAHVLPGTEGGAFPFWSPDSRFIGFFSQGKLKKIDVTGGPPLTLSDASAGEGGTWNRDGTIVFAPHATSGLLRVSAAGGAPASVTTLDAVKKEQSHRWPWFLPDGRHFLYVATAPNTVYVGSLDSEERTPLLASESKAVYADGYLLFMRQGTFLAQSFDPARLRLVGESFPVAENVGGNAATARAALSASTTGMITYRSGAVIRRQLVWMDRAGQERGVLAALDGAQGMDPKPDGRQVALSRVVQGNNDVWLVEVARGLASRFTFNPASDTSPLWSPDGSRLVFRSNRNGNYDLFEKPADGAADEQPLLVTPQDKAPLAWSPDGRSLLYAAQDPKTQSDLWALPLVGERKPFPVVQTSYDEVQGQFAPDGRWVAYASDESGRYEIYLRAFPGLGGKRQVSTGGGIYPRWRRDGKELFYVAPDNRMMAAPIHVSAEEGRTLSPDPPVALFPSRLTTGNTGGAGFSSRAQYAVAPDGRFLLLNVSADETSGSPITIVQNWTATLKK
jgi:serine/threonine protein kinase